MWWPWRYFGEELREQRESVQRPSGRRKSDLLTNNPRICAGGEKEGRRIIGDTIKEGAGGCIN